MGEAKRKLRGLFGGKKPVHKTTVLLVLPHQHAYARTEQAFWAWAAGFNSANPQYPFHIEPHPVLYQYPFAQAMNDCTKYFFEQTTHEYMAIWDHDAVPPDNWADLFGRGDIVSGTTWMWDANRAPVKRLQVNQFKLDEKGQSVTVVPEQFTEPYEVDIVGTHCMVIHRRVLEKLGPTPFREPEGPDGKRLMGGDLFFCRAARAAGFKITIIPTVIFDHVKEVGLRAVHESIVAMSKMSYDAGYRKALADVQARATARPEAQASLADQMAQAGAGGAA